MIHAASKNTASVVTNIRPTDVQPNAIDVRVHKVLAINAKAVFEIDENHKVHRGGAELEPDADGWFELPPGNWHDVDERDRYLLINAVPVHCATVQPAARMTYHLRCHAPQGPTRRSWTLTWPWVRERRAGWSRARPSTATASSSPAASTTAATGDPLCSRACAPPAKSIMNCHSRPLAALEVLPTVCCSRTGGV